ncbi:BrnA antitoxin family protein [Blastomonas sp.]|uniref:BrnA antitoxin family protein n=1 Tax=Blastomonas sp. TaxID=1909299 RepID=UPI002619A1DE|nr:BrnA antitoxin family protein [Blastomonas sp.]MDM7955120.1 BrnA antitoxin family protein [Blastomonas sp.]
MSENRQNSTADWDDDDLPEWTDDQFDRAEFRIGGKLIRPADGTLTKPGRPKSDNPKQQVTLRLDSAVLEGFRATGPGWQSRINAELRKALKLDG